MSKQPPAFSNQANAVPRWRKTPPGLFPQVLGLFGLAVAWSRTADAFGTPPAIGQLLMGAMAFGSFPLIALNLGHICVELLQLSEDSVFARVINIVASLMTAAVFFILTQQVQVFAERTGRSGEILPQLGLNWEWVWWTIFGFSILTIICALIAAIQQALHIKNRSKKVVAP